VSELKVKIHYLYTTCNEGKNKSIPQAQQLDRETPDLELLLYNPSVGVIVNLVPLIDMINLVILDLQKHVFFDIS
jgi:hypothetical protein